MIRTPIDPLPPARPVMIHGLADGFLALDTAAAVGRSALLISPPGAAGYAGAGWFKELVTQWQAARPEAAFVAILDCANWPGRVLEALRAGLSHIRFVAPMGDDRSQAELSALAAAHRATLWREIGDVLDLRRTGKPGAACRAWMAGEPLQNLTIVFDDPPPPPDLASLIGDLTDVNEYSKVALSTAEIDGQ